VSWEPGTQVDRYRILGRLGAGGMGVVYRAQDLETGASYALKTLPTSADPELVERFRREGEAQARADAHPNVVRIHSGGTALDHHYLVMDLATGGDLSELLRQGPLSPEHARAVGIQLAAGLEWLHQAGVLHRDLKPANVLFDEDQRPLLVDFGLARLEGAESLTQSGTIMGTPAYMSPEQASGDRAQVGPGSDVFGLGALLYHCLTGRPPFQGASTIATLLEVLESEPTPIRSLAPEVPPGLAAACARALQKDPARRFPSAAAFGAALAQDQKTPARSPWPLALLGGLTLLVAALLWASTTRQVAETPTPTLPPSKARESPLPSLKSWFELLPKEKRPPKLPRGLTPDTKRGHYRNTQDGSILVWIPPGAFEMGDESASLNRPRPQRVVVPEGFFLGKFEVSRAQFLAFTEAKKLQPLPALEGEGAQHPARATWAQAHAYCEWAGLRLPAGAEWELAAGGTDERAYPWGDRAPTLHLANFRLPGRMDSALFPVEACEAGETPEGCRNMAGNLPEWTSDQAWRALAGEAFVSQATKKQITRGGSYASPQRNVRTYATSMASPSSGAVGFRVALSSRSPRDPAERREALTFHRQARELRTRHHYTDAAAEIDEAVLRAEPGSLFAHEALKERATIRNYAKDYRGAVEDLTLLIQHSPHDAKPLRDRAFNYVELQETALAEADFRRVLKDSGASPELLEEARLWLEEHESRRRRARD